MPAPGIPQKAPRRPARITALLNTPLGSVIAWPWFDRVALWGLARWFLPLSRAWAAATAGSRSTARAATPSACSRVPLSPAVVLTGARVNG